MRSRSGLGKSGHTWLVSELAWVGTWARWGCREQREGPANEQHLQRGGGCLSSTARAQGRGRRVEVAPPTVPLGPQDTLGRWHAGTEPTVMGSRSRCTLEHLGPVAPATPGQPRCFLLGRGRMPEARGGEGPAGALGRGPQPLAEAQPQAPSSRKRPRSPPSPLSLTPSVPGRGLADVCLGGVWWAGCSCEPGGPRTGA